MVVLWLVVGRADRPPMPKKASPQAVQNTNDAANQPDQPTFPPGDRTLFPTYRFVALYGSPDTPALGVLGEAPMDQTIERAKALAGIYQTFTAQKMLPTLEVIATVAAASPGDDGNYSRESSVERLRPWVMAAQEAGVYVVLDLQPGRTDFLSQAKQYEELLRQPNVGLALDPEWRLKPDQLHLKQIGAVDIEEVNATADWLASLTTAHDLPQKVFLLHQFRLSMLPGRERLNTSHDKLAYIIQMDGNGAQSTKLTTWRSVQASLPSNVYMGWKNFYNEDLPVLTPQETMALSPVPWYISYQ